MSFDYLTNIDELLEKTIAQNNEIIALMKQNNQIQQQLLMKDFSIDAPNLANISLNTDQPEEFSIRMIPKFVYNTVSSKIYEIIQTIHLSLFYTVTGNVYYDIATIPLSPAPQLGIQDFEKARITKYKVVGYGLWGVADPLTDIPDFGKKTDIILKKNKNTLGHIYITDEGDWVETGDSNEWEFNSGDNFVINGKGDDIVDSYLSFDFIMETYKISDRDFVKGTIQKIQDFLE